MIVFNQMSIRYISCCMFSVHCIKKLNKARILHEPQDSVSRRGGGSNGYWRQRADEAWQPSLKDPTRSI